MVYGGSLWAGAVPEVRVEAMIFVGLAEWTLRRAVDPLGESLVVVRFHQPT
jgi:hypothetical protein